MILMPPLGAAAVEAAALDPVATEGAAVGPLCSKCLAAAASLAFCASASLAAASRALGVSYRCVDCVCACYIYVCVCVCMCVCACVRVFACVRAHARVHAIYLVPASEQITMVIKFNLSHVASKFPSSLCTQARGTTNPHSCSHHHHLPLCPIPNLYQQHIPFPPSLPCTQALCALPLTARFPLPRSIPVLPSPPLACTVNLPCPPTISIRIL